MRYITLVEMRLTSRAVTKLVIWCHRVSAPLRELRSWTFTLTTGAELYRTRRLNRRAWIHKFRGFPKRSRNHFAPKQAAIMKLASGYLLQKSQDTLLHPERCCALGKSLLANVFLFFFLMWTPLPKRTLRTRFASLLQPRFDWKSISFLLIFFRKQPTLWASGCSVILGRDTKETISWFRLMGNINEISNRLVLLWEEAYW